MHRQTLSWFLVGGLGLAACGGSPASPTTASPGGVLDAAAETTANAMVMQALSQTAASGVTLASSPTVSPVHTFACPEGGNVTTTVSVPALTANGGLQVPFTMTSRTEFNDCRSQNVTMRGAPALVHSSEFSPSGPTSGPPTVLTATMRTSGGIAIISNGVESRMLVDCTTVMVAPVGQPGSTPLPQFTWTGTMTWESPVGVVTRTTGCGPSR